MANNRNGGTAKALEIETFNRLDVWPFWSFAFWHSLPIPAMMLGAMMLPG